MKVYISCDIEGCAGVTHWDECAVTGADYQMAREQMTREAAAACHGALAAGAGELLVRDAHGSTRNLIHSQLPQEARLLRGSSGDLFPMITGAQLEQFDALLFVGYHSAAGSSANPLSHTFNRLTTAIRLNGELMSEFLSYAYAAATIGLPQVLLSGDEALCRMAAAWVPGITTVATKSCRGGATISLHPERAIAGIRAAAEQALRSDFRHTTIALPESFEMVIDYRDHQMAYDKSFYPGAELIDERRLRYAADDFVEIMRFVHFVL